MTADCKRYMQISSAYYLFSTVFYLTNILYPYKFGAIYLARWSSIHPSKLTAAIYGGPAFLFGNQVPALHELEHFLVFRARATCCLGNS